METARRRGPQCQFWPKEMPATTIVLTRLGKQILAAARDRLEMSNGEVVEMLLRRYGGHLQPMEKETDAA